MTKPRSDDAAGKSEKPEGKSAAVGVRADAANEQDTVNTDATEPVEGSEDDSVLSDDAEAKKQPHRVEPDKAKPRIERPRRRARGVKGRQGETKPQSGSADAGSGDDESLEGEAEQPVDVDADEQREGGEAEASASDEAEAEAKADDDEPAKAKFRVSWPRVLVYGVLPGLALLLAVAAGVLKWHDSSARESQLARIESVAAAKDSTIALLSYKSDTVEKDLEAAKGRLAGTFKDSYSQLINDVVIPGAKREHISTTATVPAAASVSATPNHAVTLLFVNQSAVVDKNPPTDTTSSVRVTLDKIDGRWLISGFDPV